jgi:FAD/FMN-containing dehydrogenase
MTEESWFAASDADRERFRRFRHALPEAVNTTVRQRGLMKMGTDFAVPLNRNREMMAYYHRKLDPLFPGQYVVFGHIGDAHVHVNLLPKDGDEAEIAKALITEMAKQAVAFGGTVAAEHGLGKRKSHLLQIQYCREEIDAMLTVKRRLDPQDILGQGNLFGTIQTAPGIV